MPSRCTRLPEWADIRLIEYCRERDIMKCVTGADGKKIKIPNVSEGMKQIVIDFFNCQNDGK